MCVFFPPFFFFLFFSFPILAWLRQLATHRDMADEHPSAEIKGTDLSPIQPSSVPPNCLFEIDDYNKEWEYKNKFDLIHTRELLGSVPNWVEFFRKALK